MSSSDMLINLPSNNYNTKNQIITLRPRLDRMIHESSPEPTFDSTAYCSHKKNNLNIDMDKINQ